MEHNTRQRQAIISCLRESAGPLSPREILEYSRETAGRMGIATVYRNLRRLVLKGIVREQHFPGEGTRYEMTSLGHHHHFYCRQCRRVYCIEGCPADFQAKLPCGFVLEEHEVLLYGTCQDCTQAS
ncbi:MAG: Fur family transcriptional regulator [Desulfonatronovibrionaceae bacterium]